MRTVFLIAAAITIAATATAQAIGSVAPDITWTGTFEFGDIQKQKLSDLRGSVVLLEFWGTH